MRRGLVRFAFVALVVSGLSGRFSYADLATVHLSNGEGVTVDLLAVDRGQVQWQPPSGGQAKSFLRSQIDYVDFPTTPEWRDAEEAFQSGDIEGAIAKYKTVIANANTQYYPMPGNFASLAKVQLLVCYRVQMNPAAIAKQAAQVRDEYLDLPPEFRKMEPEVLAWIAVSKEKWEEVLTELENAAAPGPEVFLLRGMALENLGRDEEAVQAYAGGYVMNFGGSVALSKAALSRSSALLAKMGNEDRNAELKAQAKIYRDLYGRGSLWEGAPEWVAVLADAEIETLGAAEGEMLEPDAAAGAGGGTVVTQDALVASLPPLEERDWILPAELDERIYLLSKEEDAERTVSVVGGVIDNGDHLQFDGTGGGIRASGMDGSVPDYKLVIRFRADAPDGVLYERRGGEGGKHGVGLYLVDGKVKFLWAPVKERKIEVLDLGEVTIGEPTIVSIRVDRTGKVTVHGTLFPDGPHNDKVARNGLKMWHQMQLMIGDHGKSDEAPPEKWIQTTPFTGAIYHLRIVSAPNGSELGKLEMAKFDGKKVRFNPPPEEVESEEVKPEEGNAQEVEPQEAKSEEANNE